MKFFGKFFSSRKQTFALPVPAEYGKIYTLLSSLDASESKTEKKPQRSRRVIGFLKDIFRKGGEWFDIELRRYGRDTFYASFCIAVSLFVIELLAMAIVATGNDPSSSIPLLFACFSTAWTMFGFLIEFENRSVMGPKKALTFILGWNIGVVLGASIISLFFTIPAPLFVVAVPLFVVVSHIAIYLYNGLKGAIVESFGTGRETKGLEVITPQNVTDLRAYVARKVQETVARHRDEVMGKDSEFASRIAEAEAAREKAKSLIAALEVQGARGDSDDFIRPRLARLREFLAKAEENLRNIQQGKETILHALRQFEVRCAEFDILLDRLAIDEKITELEESASSFREETMRFIEAKCDAFRADVEVLLHAMNEVAFLTAGEGASTPETLEERVHRVARFTAAQEQQALLGS